jgi:acetate kinase
VEQSVPEGEKSKVVKEVIKIGNNIVVMGDCFKGSVIVNGSAQNQISSSSGFSQS